MKKSPEIVLAEVPRQVFEKFLTELSSTGMQDAVVQRLRATLLGNADLSEGAIRKALFKEDEQA